jgi:hypothetical protein
LALLPYRGEESTEDEAMADRDDFLAWVRTALYEAELALHNGNAGPRRALWSRKEPVSVLGAWRNAGGQQELDKLFTTLGKSFSECTSYVFDLQTYDVSGDMAYTVGLEHTSVSVDGDRAPTPCGPYRCTAAKRASGRSPIAMATRCPGEGIEYSTRMQRILGAPAARCRRLGETE